MSDTMQRIRGHLEEMFGPERAKALSDDAKPWCDAIGAKTIDVIDFRLLIEMQFDVKPHPYFIERASLAELVAYLDARTSTATGH